MMPILAYFPCIVDGGGGKEGSTPVALGPVSEIKTLSSSKKTYVKWTDPEDVQENGEVVAYWAGTILVRKEGSFPEDQNDGIVILNSTERNQYQNSYFLDETDLVNETEYYYKFFPYTTRDVYTYDKLDEFNATPTVQVEGIEDWKVDFSESSVDDKMTGIHFDLLWTDPSEEIISDGVVLATWATTTVVIKWYDADTFDPDTFDPPLYDDPEAEYRYVSYIYNDFYKSPLYGDIYNGTGYYVFAWYPETKDGGMPTIHNSDCFYFEVIDSFNPPMDPE